MGAIWANRTRVRQPQPGARLGDSALNPAFVFYGNGGTRDIAGGLRATHVSGDAFATSAVGRSFRGGRVANGGLQFGSVQPITGDTFTILALANPVASSTVQTLFSQRSGSGNFPQIDLAVNSNTSLAGSPGIFAGITLENASGSASRSVVSNASTYADGKFHVYGMTRAGVGTNPALYFDGAAVSVSATGASTGSSFSTAMQTAVGNIGDYATDGTYAANCDIAFVVLWNGLLTGQKIAQFSTNLWQLFAPQRTARIYSFPTGGATVAVPAGALTLTGYAPTVSFTAHQTISVPTGALTLTGFAPTVSTSAAQTIAVPAASLTLTGFAPTVAATANQSISVPAGSLTLTGYAPTVYTTAVTTIAVPAGTLTLTGYAPTVSYTTHAYIGVPAGALTLTGYAPTVIGGTSSIWTPASASGGTWTPQ